MSKKCCTPNLVEFGRVGSIRIPSFRAVFITKFKASVALIYRVNNALSVVLDIASSWVVIIRFYVCTVLYGSNLFVWYSFSSLWDMYKKSIIWRVTPTFQTFFVHPAYCDPMYQILVLHLNLWSSYCILYFFD